MTTNTTNPWVRTHTEVLDQRALPMPAAWQATQVNRLPTLEVGRSIHISGNQGALRDELITLLNQAVDMAVVCSFLIADPAFEAALKVTAERGVRVYVMLASEARLGSEPNQGEFDQKTHAQHKAMLKTLGKSVLFRTAAHFHAKVVLVDPYTRPAGVLLTANLTQEALTRNEELAVRLSPTQVEGIAGYLRWAMWQTAEHELLDGHDFKAAKLVSSVQHPTPQGEICATTMKHRGIAKQLQQALKNASSHIIVSSFGWDVQHPVLQQLCQRAREGLKVTVLARVRTAAMPALLALAESGAQVYGFKWLHAKALWTDAGDAMVMSANLEAHGLDDSFELGALLDVRQAEELKVRLEHWQNIAPWHLLPAPTLGDLSGEVQLWRNGQLNRVQVLTEAEVNLGEVVAQSAHQLETPRPGVSTPSQSDDPAHQLKCCWTATAPYSHPKASPQMRPAQGNEKPQPYSPKVLREPDGRLTIAITQPSELNAAVQLLGEMGAAAIVIDRGQRP
ncbi:phospholipase D-like domain-containing protein [Pseudomonas capsici]|uniref:phospholipase D-like domain-containing protein n=1 Tax=Pseudomonas capsici TaxID=2810614 RepID=UPI0021F0FFE6|nr:phospholipase D-like domain-containing protein [Pseudomonas capsici]MCV4263500.1 phospholipase D-like domain-containing protein [Pseudomonas capsici]